jgi:transposase
VISNDVSDRAGGGTDPRTPVDPAPRPKRRTFTAEYKLAVVAEYEAAPHGEKSAVLRREGLYHSHIKEWATARDAGARRGVQAAPETAPGAAARTREKENQRLVERNEQLTGELARTRTALEIMGKAHELLELLSESTGTTTPPRRS